MRYCCFELRGLFGMVISMRPASSNGAMTWSRNLVRSVRPDGPMSPANARATSASSRTRTWYGLSADLAPTRHQVPCSGNDLGLERHRDSARDLGECRIRDAIRAASLDDPVGATAPDLDGAGSVEGASDEGVAWDRSVLLRQQLGANAGRERADAVELDSVVEYGDGDVRARVAHVAVNDGVDDDLCILEVMPRLADRHGTRAAGASAACYCFFMCEVRFDISDVSMAALNASCVFRLIWAPVPARPGQGFRRTWARKRSEGTRSFRIGAKRRV